MNTVRASAGWSLRRVQQMLRLSRRVVTGLIAEGLVSPTRGPRNAWQFSFQDLVLLRTAHGLRRARVPLRSIVRALGELRTELPQALPLTGLHVTADGRRVVVRDAAGPRDAVSGQFLLDFRVVPDDEDELAVVDAIETQPAEEEYSTPSAAQDAFDQAEQAESDDRDAAARGYRQTLAFDPTHVNAYINLGALLCEDGACEAALVLFEAAARHGVRHALLSFNRALALEDLGDEASALGAYEEALTLDPGCADAHFNVARLLERRGDLRGALRHFNDYRGLVRERDAAAPA